MPRSALSSRKRQLESFRIVHARRQFARSQFDEPLFGLKLLADVHVMVFTVLAAD